MANIFKIEIKRSICTKYFIFLLFLAIIIHVYSNFVWDSGFIFFDYSAPDINREAAKMIINQSINRYMFWYHSMDVYTVIMPMLATLPFGASLMSDKKTGYYNFIVTRVSKARYLMAKITANAFAGGIVLILPSIFYYLIIAMTTSGSTSHLTDHPIGFMSSIFMNAPQKYILYYTIFEFIFGVVYATFAMAVSCLVSNKIVISLIPFLYWYVGTFVFERINLQAISPAMANAFMVRGNSNGLLICLLDVVILSCSLYLIWLKSLKNNEV